MNKAPQNIQVLKQTPAGRTVRLFDSKRSQWVIRKEVNLDAAQVWIAAFEKEIEVLRKLDGHWFPRLIENGMDGSVFYLIETCFEGIALDEWLAAKPRRKERREMFEQIVALIARVHAAGYLYLDLKADNVIIVNSRACLIDFNACLPIGSSRPVLVNKDSLPPEGAKGHAMNEAADQIGLGRLYMRMLGPSWIAWIALSDDPKKRFSSLTAMKKAVHKTQDRRKALLMVSTAALCAAAGIFVPLAMMNSASDDTASTKEETPLLLEEQKAPSAAQICERLAQRGALEDSDVLSESEWIAAARAALQEKHFGLAGYLLEHPCTTSSYSVELYDVLLALMLSKSIEKERLYGLVRALPMQSAWREPMQVLFQVLGDQRIPLPGQMLEEMFFGFDDLEMIDEACAIALMGYLLSLKAEGILVYCPDKRLMDVLEKRAPEYARLLLNSLSEDRAQSSEAQREESFAASFFEEASGMPP